MLRLVTAAFPLKAPLGIEVSPIVSNVALVIAEPAFVNSPLGKFPAVKVVELIAMEFNVNPLNVFAANDAMDPPEVVKSVSPDKPERSAAESPAEMTQFVMISSVIHDNDPANAFVAITNGEPLVHTNTMLFCAEGSPQSVKPEKALAGKFPLMLLTVI